MDFDINKLKNPKFLNYVVLVLILAIVGGVWYKFTFLELKAEEEKIKQEYEKKNKELEALKEMRKNLLRLKNEVQKSKQQLEKLKVMFPEEEEVENLIYKITKICRLNNVLITKFTPAGNTIKDYYIEHKYSISLSTTYHKLGQFLADIANLKLIVNVGNFNIKKQGNLEVGEEIDPQDIQSTINASFQLTTYTSKKKE